MDPPPKPAAFGEDETAESGVASAGHEADKDDAEKERI